MISRTFHLIDRKVVVTALRCLGWSYSMAQRTSLNKLYNTQTLPKFSSIRPQIPKPTKQTKTFSHIFQECTNIQALNPGKQAHARMIVFGFIPTTFVTNCLMQLYVRSSCLEYARQVFDKMPHRDVISWNSLVFGYAGCGEMGIAREFFYAMPDRDTVSWNSMMSGYLHNCEYWEAIDVFKEMNTNGTVFDQTSLAIALKLCSILENHDFGIQVHGNTIKLGFDIDVVTASALLDMYGKCKNLDDSLTVFSEMPQKNSVSWSAVIAGCVQNGKFINGVKLFKGMQHENCQDFRDSQSIYASVLRSCAGLSDIKLGTQLHCNVVKNGFTQDVIVSTATLDMYAKCDNMLDARKLFSSMRKPNLQSHNVIITGFVRNGRGIEALGCLRLLLKSGLGFDGISLSGAFTACGAISGFLEGIQVHGLAMKSINLNSNICASNAILDMYGKCGLIREACLVFDEMELRDPVSWNAIIAAHEQNGCEDETRSIFVSMLRSMMEPDEFTYGSIMKACTSKQDLNSGIELHSRIIKSGMGFHSFVGGALVDMYCKCGNIEEAEKVHRRTEELTTVSWNTIISGFSLQNQSEDGLKYFSNMLKANVRPDSFTYATILDISANLATAELGKQIHAQIIKQSLQFDVYICSTIVDMYSKCGNMNDSRLVFDKAQKRDLVMWNSIICGYAHHGLGEEALKLFETLKLENMKPNHATFVSVLRACAHIGLVEKGLQYFDVMQANYGLDPQLEHYSCLVDIIGRSGRGGVYGALKVIEDMPMEADGVIWGTLLNVCKLHGNVEVAEKAASFILRLEPDNSSVYILLSNIYSDAAMWEDVSRMRKMMRHNKVKKEPGCSWVEVKDEIHAFLIGDKAHPRCNEIYDILALLTDDMKKKRNIESHESACGRGT